MNKFLLISITLFSLSFMYLLYGIINGSGCSYSISNMQTSENRTMFSTCKRGKVVILQYHHDENDNLLSIWKIKARQIVYKNQLIFIIYDRTQVLGKMEDNPTDIYNRLSQGYGMMFYYYNIINDKIIFMQDFPKNRVFHANINGTVSIF